MVSFTYPLAHINYDTQEIDAVARTLHGGQTTCGPRVREFENTFAAFVGTKHATMVNSGSSADLLVAFGLGEPDERDEILVPAVTWPTQVWSCLAAGYKVRLIDVDPLTLQMSEADLSRNISERTRAVFLVHLLGNVGNLERIQHIVSEFDAEIIEDCCESLGAKWSGKHVGTFGKAAAFSFFFSHLISTMEGGMLVTSEDDRQYRLLRSHGWEPQPDCRFSFPTWGFNVRPMEIQAAFGTVQMTKLAQFQYARTSNEARLRKALEDIPWLQPCRVLEGCEPSWHGFPLLVDAPEVRDTFCTYLEQNGIETRPIVAGNIARQQAVLQSKPGRIVFGSLPGADRIHDHGFYIGLASFSDEAGIDHVAKVIQNY